jgi:indolepyruvate ferredoxin oxidoreductase, alpha subunit
MINILEKTSEGTIALAYGNEAVGRGALEAGVRLVTGYPGNPSSGALRAFENVPDNTNVHVQYASNEKVAMEVAWGAAMCGQRVLCSVNQLGTHVLVDALCYSVSSGIRGGLVLFTADDIGANTSAIEADSRLIGAKADIPIIEPADVQEAKDMARFAFELSEELTVPVMLRGVNQVMLAKEMINLDTHEPVNRTSQFASPTRDLPDAPGLRPQIRAHRFLHLNFKKATEILGKMEYDRMELQTGAKVGIIGCGVGYNLAKEALDQLGLTKQVSLLKLGVLNPLNEDLISRFLKSVDLALVLEEGEPFVELRIQALKGKYELSGQVLGRFSGAVEYGGELLIPAISLAIESAFREAGVTTEAELPYSPISPPLPSRMASLCAGCSHLGAFYAMKKAVDTVTDGRYIGIADAGCSWIGTLPYKKIFNISTDMGGAIGIASGAALVECDEPVIVVVGDGGFLHGGFSGLVNAIKNEAPIVVLVLDNRTLANTGLQPTGTSVRNAIGNKSPSVDIAEVCRGMGISFVETANPMKPVEMTDVISRALQAPKPAVVVAQAPCEIDRLRDERAAGILPKVARIIPEVCTACDDCIELGCPAISWEAPRDTNNTTAPIILTDICSGCELCMEVCNPKAIVMEDVKL